MNAEEMGQLRTAFRAEQIGKIPKGGVQLDYVGHAHVTDRLLEVDPEWTWAPMGVTAEGLPALDQFGNLWIELTVCGVTRPGVGDGKTMKECVGDALRNAAMRFGVALDLWAKGDAHFGLAGHDAPDRAQTIRQQGPSLREQVMAAAKPHFTDRATFEADFEQVTGTGFGAASNPALEKYLAHLDPFAPQPPDASTPPAPVVDDGIDHVQVIRDAVLAAVADGSLSVAKRKAALTRQLFEIGRLKLGTAPTTDAAGKGLSLERLAMDALKEKAA